MFRTQKKKVLVYGAALLAIQVLLLFWMAWRFRSLGEDEGQIVDFGRRLLNGDATLAQVWNGASARPFHTYSWVSSLLVELAWRGTEAFWGPRIVSLLGVLFLGLGMSALFAKVRPESGWLALVFGTVLAWDPFNVGLSVSGRMDVVAVSVIVFGSVAAWEGAQKAGVGWLVLAGGLLALAPYIWVRAVCVYPLALFGLAMGCDCEWRLIRRRVVPLILSGLVVGLILSVPMWIALGDTGANGDMPTGAGSRLWLGVKRTVSALLKNPGLLIGWSVGGLVVLAAGLQRQKDALWLIFCVVAGCGLSQWTASQFHSAHYVYLLPFAGLCFWHAVGLIRCTRPCVLWIGLSMLLINIGIIFTMLKKESRPTGAAGYAPYAEVQPLIKKRVERLLCFDPRMYYGMRIDGIEMVSNLWSVTDEQMKAFLVSHDIDGLVMPAQGSFTTGSGFAEEWVIAQGWKLQTTPSYRVYLRLKN